MIISKYYFPAVIRYMYHGNAVFCVLIYKCQKVIGGNFAYCPRNRRHESTTQKSTLLAIFVKYDGDSLQKRSS